MLPALRAPARRQAGFGLSAVMYLLAIIGVIGAIAYSGTSQVLRSQIDISRDIEVKANLRAAARTVSALSQLTNGATTIRPPDATLFAALAPSDAGKLPASWANAGVVGAPVTVGVLPAGLGTPQLDPWRKFFILCTWEPATDPGTDAAFLLISAGADQTLDTDCGASAPGHDDYMELLNAAQATDRANVWQYQDGATPEAKFGLAVDAVSVTAAGDITARSLTLATPLPVAVGGTGAATAGGARSNLGASALGDALFTAAAPSNARTALEAGATGDLLFQSTNATSGRVILGAGALGDELFTAATPDIARTMLGSGATGDALFLTDTEAAARTALGASSVGDAVFTAATPAAGRAALDAGATGDAMFMAATAADGRAVLGAGAVGGNVFQAVNQTDALTALGLIGGSGTLDVGINGTATMATSLSDGANILAGAVPINRGGTGSTSAAAARTALGTDDAANLTSGLLPWARLPASGVVAGAYNWGTVNAYGLVEAASNVDLTLGALVSSNNPAKSGDATTGLFSNAAGTVQVAASGTEIFRVTSAGADIRSGSLKIAGNNGLAVPAGSASSLVIGSTGATAMTGANNLAFGTQTLNAVGAGANNIGIGNEALKFLVGGGNNIAIGYQAIALGAGGNNNIAIGNLAGSQLNSSSTQNTFVGGNAAAPNTSGSQNAAFGFQSLSANATGSFNTAIGAFSVGGGNYIVGVGFSAGSKIAGGSRNTVIGAQVASVTLTTGTGNILIGTSAAVDTPTASTSNWLNIGNNIYGDLAATKIGIGQSSPQATLDVNGFMRLAVNGSAPAACSATNNGALALTSAFTLCACKGASTSWVRTSDGTTACTW